MTQTKYELDREKVAGVVLGLRTIAKRDLGILDYSFIEDVVDTLSQDELFLCLEEELGDSAGMRENHDDRHACALEFAKRKPVQNKSRINKKKLLAEIDALLQLRELLTCERIRKYALNLSRNELKYVVCTVLARSFGIRNKVEEEDLYSTVILVDEFSKFVADVFHEEGIVYIGDLIPKDEAYFEQIPGFGSAKLAQVHTFLEKLNLHLDTPVPEWNRPSD